MYQRILVPVDFSEPGARAMAHAVALARAVGAEVVLFHAYERPTPPKVPATDATLRAYNNLLADLWTHDGWRETVATNRDALALARKVGNVRWETIFLSGPIYALYMVGLWDEALAQAAEVVGRAATEFAHAMVLGVLPVHLGRGALEDAREVARSTPAARSENPDQSGWNAMLQAALLRVEGHPEDALASAERAHEIHAATGDGPGSLTHAECLEAAALVGDDELRRRIALLDGLAPGELTPFLRAQHARLRARLAPPDADEALGASARWPGPRRGAGGAVGWSADGLAEPACAESGISRVHSSDEGEEQRPVVFDGLSGRR